MLLVNSSQYYNTLDLIFVNHLYGMDYLPFNQPSTQFEQNYKKDEIWNKMSYKKMLKKENIVSITFSDTETTLLQKQQLNLIQPLSYKKLSTPKQY